MNTSLKPTSERITLSLVGLHLLRIRSLWALRARGLSRIDGGDSIVDILLLSGIVASIDRWHSSTVSAASGFGLLSLAKRSWRELKHVRDGGRFGLRLSLSSGLLTPVEESGDGLRHDVASPGTTADGVDKRVCLLRCN
jgi:hypothetical protein